METLQKHTFVTYVVVHVSNTKAEKFIKTITYITKMYINRLNLMSLV